MDRFRDVRTLPTDEAIEHVKAAIRKSYGKRGETVLQKKFAAVDAALQGLHRYDPRLAHDGGHPFHLDSHKPSVPFRTFAEKEARYAMLQRSDPQRAEQLFGLAQRDIDERWHFYEQMAGVERTVVQTEEEE